ncbi:MAG: T9SS type A sorting domain-containing protein [Bacteroidia bacterium]|nr:T9SS type A sorting domain-containing protein [Bacteroidia bacterium]
MKVFRLILLTMGVMFTLPFTAFGQANCTPDTSIKTVGLYPDTLKTGYVGIAYSDTLQAVLPTDTAIAPLVFSFCRYKIVGTTPDLDSLGLGFDCDQPDCDYKVDHASGTKLNWGCVIISGTPTKGNDSLFVLVQADLGTYIPLQDTCITSASLTLPFSFEFRILDTTSTSIFRDLDQQALQMKLYPNPSSGLSHLEFDMPLNGDVEIDLVNSIGQKVQSVFSGLAHKGHHVFEIPTGELAQGLYFVRINLNNGENILARRLAINR